MSTWCPRGVFCGWADSRYAPNVPEPLDVLYEMTGRGERQGKSLFDHDRMVERYPAPVISGHLAEGRHFFDAVLPWNGLCRFGSDEEPRRLISCQQEDSKEDANE